MNIPDAPSSFANSQPAGTLASILTYAYDDKDTANEQENSLNAIWASLKHNQVRCYQKCAALALEEALNIGPLADLKGLKASTFGKISGYTGRHFLQHMATGSGKTMLIAESILSFYQRGYRRFVFLVNQTSILDKTRYNLLPSLGHFKCEFGNIQPLSDGHGNLRIPRILEARGRFFQNPGQDIEILFTTIHDLHNQINQPNSSGIALNDLKQAPMVLIGDEAHHFNAGTKKGVTNNEEATWEKTIETLMGLHPKNYLIEFSATVDMSHKAMKEKYAGRLVFDLPLKTLRALGYSKNVELMQSAGGPLDRTLAAIIVSQHRANIAQENNIGLLPRVLVKSTGEIKDLEIFSSNLLSSIANLEISDIRRLVSERVKNGSLIMESLFSDIFHKLSNTKSASDFLDQVKANFGIDNTLMYHSKLPSKEIDKARVALSQIDHDPDRRLLFAVNALNEGIDVLSLFDIVKIDDTSVKKDSTTSEVQLIGRGARYFPMGGGEDRFKRKYDGNPKAELSWLEAMTFHSAHNNVYINTIKDALVEAGFIDDQISRVIDHKAPPAWLDGAFVFSNNILARQYNTIPEFSSIIKGREVVMPIAAGFKSFNHEVNKDFVNQWRWRLNRELRRFPLFDLARYSAQFSKGPLEVLGSLNKPFSITVGHKSFEDATPTEQRDAFRELVNLYYVVASNALRELYGAQHLTPTVSLQERKLGDFFGPITTKHQDVRDFSHVKVSHYNQIALDSDLERSFIDKIVESTGDDPNKYWLIRNPQLVKFHEFENGSQFRPDFILLRNDGIDKDGKQHVAVFYVECKGDHLKGEDQWKEDLLTGFVSQQPSITHEGIVYSFHGLPFFEEKHENTKGGGSTSSWENWVAPIITTSVNVGAS